MTTGKTIALTWLTFVGNVMSLLFNRLPRFVIAFLPRSKCPLISWLQLPSAMILEPRQNKASHCFHCFPIYLPWSDGTGCHDFRFSLIKFHFFYVSSRNLVLNFQFSFLKQWSPPLGILTIWSVVDLKSLSTHQAITQRISAKSVRVN